MVTFRISEREQWEEAKRIGFYTDESLNKEGFIHMSQRHQVTLVAGYLYKDQENLLLLAVDTDKLTSELRLERLGTDEPFPHIYGVINLDAVIAVTDFLPNEDSSFSFPENFPK
jgi:uncharacterized protein (DUF952 family)